MRPSHFLAIVAVSSVLIAGCGQKGPLYLRENPPPNVKLPKPDQYKPVPYPKGVPTDPEPGAESAK